MKLNIVLIYAVALIFFDGMDNKLTSAQRHTDTSGQETETNSQTIKMNKFEELKRQYRSFHNKTLENFEIVDAIRRGREKIQVHWDSPVELALNSTGRILRSVAMPGASERENARRRVQFIDSAIFLISLNSPAFVIGEPKKYLCVTVKRNKKAKPRGHMYLQDCQKGSVQDMLFDTNTEGQIFLQVPGGNNIFGGTFCIDIKKPKENARLDISNCDVLEPEQQWNLLRESFFWKPSRNDGLCVTSRPYKASRKGGGRLVLKACGQGRDVLGQKWVSCDVETATSCFVDDYGRLDCSLDDFIFKCGDA